MQVVMEETNSNFEVISTTIDLYITHIDAYRFVSSTRYKIRMKLDGSLVDYIVKSERVSKLSNNMFRELSIIQG